MIPALVNLVRRAIAVVRYERTIPGSVALNEATGNDALVPGGVFVNGA